MLDPVIIRRIREAERKRRREQREQPQIPLYYEPPEYQKRPRAKEDETESHGGTVIEIDL